MHPAATEQDSRQQQRRDQDLNLWADLSKTSIDSVDSELIQTKEGLDELCESLWNIGTFAFDTETNGTFDLFRVRIVGLSFAWCDKKGYHARYLPLAHYEGEQVNYDYAFEVLKSLLESPELIKICHNAKFDEKVLARQGIQIQGVTHCTMVMAWMLQERRESKGLKQLVEQLFHVEMETYEDVVSAARKIKGQARDYNFARVALDSALSYAGADAYWTFRLFELFKPQLLAEKLWDAYTHVERPFVRVLRNMELRGVCIDVDKVDYADVHLPKVIEEVEAEIYAEAGEVFNIGSGAQLGNILFGKLGIGNNVPRTKSGSYRTDKKTLNTYAAKNRIVENVLRRKKIQKTHSTFVQSLKDHIASDSRIHPSFNGSGTATGRLSCRSPNLQQIEGDEVEEIRIRDFFIPAPGHRFLVGDYSQVELRLMAHFAKDQQMIDAFNSGRDFHEETARRMYNLGVDDTVAARQRFHAKAINFGIGYGRQAESIAEQLNCTTAEAESYMERWGESFPDVIKYRDYVHSQARQLGYVRTLTGRKRRLLPEIQSSIRWVRRRAERQAFNTKIQGSAADIIKMAMLALEPRLEEFGAHILLQIHDELVIEVPEDSAEDLLEPAKHIMEHPFKGINPLRLPLVVEPKIVDKWGDAK